HDDNLLGTLKFISKTKDYQIYKVIIPDGMIKDEVMLSKAYKTYLDYATGKVPPEKARKFKQPASLKLKTVLASPKEHIQRVSELRELPKRPLLPPTTSVVIKDTPDKSVSKNKAPSKIGRGKGIELLSDAALLKEAHLRETLRKSKQETHKLQASGSNDSTDSEADSWGDSKDKSDNVHDEDDNDDDDGDDDESGNDDDGGNDDSEKMFEEEDDDVAKELYEDLNITQGLRDTDMTNAEQGREDQQNASHESWFVQEEKDAHVTLLTGQDKTKDKDEDPSVGSDRGTKRRKSIKDNEPLKGSNSKESKSSSSSKGTQSQHKSSGPAFNLLKGTCKSFTKLEYHFEECYKAVNDCLDWHNPEGRKYLFDLSKPLPLIEVQKQIVVRRDDNVLYKFKEGDFLRLNMDYLPKRHWSNLEMKRSRIMVKAIDKLLFEKRLMRNLEKFIGGRDYRKDLRLLERTILPCHILSFHISD
nr:hypothetical protein [Tanacetum cinerariifolium]